MSQDHDLTIVALRQLTHFIRSTAVNASFEAMRHQNACKYTAGQPRVPRGHSDGGQWTEDGFGSGRTPKNPLLQPAITRKPPKDRRPEDILEEGAGRGDGGYGGRQTFTTPSVPKSPQANRAAERIRKLNRQSADDLQETITSRAYGQTSPKEANPKIRDAAEDIEAFLGGKIRPEDIRPSKSGDLVIQKGDKKFRMDVKDPGRMKDRKTPDDPYFHFEQWNTEEGWIDASDTHRNYFKKD